MGTSSTVFFYYYFNSLPLSHTCIKKYINTQIDGNIEMICLLTI